MFHKKISNEKIVEKKLTDAQINKMDDKQLIAYYLAQVNEYLIKAKQKKEVHRGNVYSVATENDIGFLPHNRQVIIPALEGLEQLMTSPQKMYKYESFAEWCKVLTPLIDTLSTEKFTELRTFNKKIAEAASARAELKEELPKKDQNANLVEQYINKLSQVLNTIESRFTQPTTTQNRWLTGGGHTRVHTNRLPLTQKAAPESLETIKYLKEHLEGISAFSNTEFLNYYKVLNSIIEELGPVFNDFKTAHRKFGEVHGIEEKLEKRP